MPGLRRIGRLRNTSDDTLRKEHPLILVSWRVYGDTKRVIFRSKKLDGLWYAETKMPTTVEQGASPWCWDSRPRMVNMQYVMPRYDAKCMTVAGGNGPVYEKKVDLLKHGTSLFGLPWLKDVTAREIETCEALRKHAHPNVCFYRGVTVDKAGLVSGLVFDRYDANLHDMVRQGRLFNVVKCLEEIEKGMEHIHSLGFVHCDIKPENIFVQVQGQRYVVGDFDSTHQEGEALDIKCGTPGWVPRDDETQDVAKREIDFFSRDMIRVWLEQKVGGCAMQDQEYPRTQLIQEQVRKARGIVVQVPATPPCADGDSMDVTW